MSEINKNNTNNINSSFGSSTYQTQRQHIQTTANEIDDTIPIKNIKMKEKSRLCLKNRLIHMKIPSLDLSSTIRQNTMITKYHHDVLNKKSSINNNSYKSHKSCKSYKIRSQSLNLNSQKNTIVTNYKTNPSSPVHKNNKEKEEHISNKVSQGEQCTCGCVIF